MEMDKSFQGLHAARAAVERALLGGVRVDGKKARVAFAVARDGEQWPPPGFAQREYPPVGSG